MPRRPRSPALAKLSRPRLFGAVARERLFARLDEARELHPGICVVGPPGAGKTTLVASWLEARRRGGIWYQIDAGDSDPATFFHYLGLAVQPYARRGQRPLPALTPEYLPDVSGFSRRFFRELFSRLPSKSVLVLDNYQEVEADNALHPLIAEAVDEVPHGSHLIVVSRADPPACYARLKANRSVTTLEWDDLRLTLEEAQAIGRLQKRDDVDVVEGLYRQCDGWAAGLILMLAEPTGRGPAGLPSQSTPEAVFDYFAGTLFDRAPETLRRMLLSVAFLPYVRADWAAELSGQADAARQLDLLYRRHFFTQRRPDAEGSYQFHALFQRFLRSRLRRRLTEADYEDLIRRSAALLREAGEIEAVFDLECERGHWDAAAETLLAEAERMIAAGRWQTFTQAIAHLPGAQLESRPWLAYWLGVALTPVNQERARRVLEGAYAAFAARGDVVGQMMSSAGVLDALALELRDLRQCSSWIDRLSAFVADTPHFSSHDTELRILASLIAPCAYSQLDLPALRASAERVLELLGTEGDNNLRLLAAIGLGMYAHTSGNLRIAESVMSILGPKLDLDDVSPVAAVRFHGSMGYCFYAMNRFDEAMVSYRKAQAIAREHGLAAHDFTVASWRGYCEWRMGDAEAMARTVAELEAMRMPDSGYSSAAFRLLQAEWAASQGRLNDAVDIARDALRRTIAAGVQLGTVSFRVVLADFLLRADRIAEAATCLDELDAALEENRFLACYRPAALAHRFLVARRQGDEDRAHQCAVDALAEGRKFGVLVYMRWAVAAMPHLCAYALEHGIHADYAHELIESYALKPPAPDVERWPWPVRVRTLGGFDVSVRDGAGGESRKAPRRLLQLLKAIVAFGGRDVPAQRLVDALWSDVEGDAGAHALQVAVTRLRKFLGGSDTILVHDARVTLNEDRCWVDALVFDRMLAENGQVTVDAGERACALYGGTFLSEEADAPWAVPARERLRARYVAHVEQLGSSFESAGQWDRAAAWYQRGIDADPLMESFHQGVIRCYARTGRKAEALSAYRRLRQTLSVVLGIAPSAATRALYDTLYLS